jgi:uncharacterized membrane protein
MQRSACWKVFMRHSTIASVRPLSWPGLFFALLGLCLSLTPSLMPRSWFVQGALSGTCAAAGYCCGAFLQWLWIYLEIPSFRLITGRLARSVAVMAGVLIAAFFVWQSSSWQNSVRALMQLAPNATIEPFLLVLTAAFVFILLVAIGRLFRRMVLASYARTSRFIPRRLAAVAGTLLSILVFWAIAEGLLFHVALRLVDSSFQEADALIDDDTPMPDDQGKTGSAASLVNWEELGRQGRHFVTSGPTRDQIGTFLQSPAKEPIRVYVGLNSADSPEARASLALAELKRQGAFERAFLIVVVPTGTGWVDPEAMDTVEYLLRGDVAEVAMQYSYLSSWLSLMVEPEYGSDAARALFNEIYAYWRTLPRDHRPKLYLHGLSLGALNSQSSVNLYDVFADPFQGALWSGPPFASSTWAHVTANRNPGSPAWLPQFRDGSMIRFANQQTTADRPDAAWGPVRIVFLQYASDPVTFFDWRALYREPDWMKGERGPDVSPYFRWFPIVTTLQLGFDAMIATTSPMGYGHVYAPQHYIDAWVAVTDPAGWSPEEIERLKAHFERVSVAK